MGKSAYTDWPASTTVGLDRRTRRTREALLRALLELLQEKPLNSITVTELTDRADVNRATFYTHYQDIFDMFDHLESDLTQTCRNMVEAHGQEIAQGDYDGLIADVYQFFADNESLFDIVFSDTNDGAFFSSLIEVIREACTKNAGVHDTVVDQLKRKGLPANSAKEACDTVCQYQFYYIAGGVVSILRKWMHSGRKESVAQMTMLTSLCIKSLNPTGNFQYAVDAARGFVEPREESAGRS